MLDPEPIGEGDDGSCEEGAVRREGGPWGRQEEKVEGEEEGGEEVEGNICGGDWQAFRGGKKGGS